MVQRVTQTRGIPTINIGKALWFWCGQKGWVLWKTAVPPGPGDALWPAWFSSTDLVWWCLCTSPGKSGHTLVKSHCLHDCSAQMIAGIIGSAFLYLGGVIKSFQSPWVLRSIFRRHRNKSSFPSAGNYLPAQTPCTCMCIHDWHVAKSVSRLCDGACKASKGALTVAVPRLVSSFSRGSCSLKAQEQPQGKG